MDPECRIIPEIIKPELKSDEETLNKIFNTLKSQWQISKDEIKDLLKKIDELSPDSKRNIFNAMDNIYEEYLPKK